MRAALLAEDRPTVIAIDDAQLLDEASATVIQQLVVAGQAAVVLTLRTGEPAPDAVRTLWKDGLIDRLELSPLSHSLVAELVEHALGGLVDPGTQARLWAATGGNPLLLREMLITGVEGANLADDSGVWHWSGPLQPGPRLAEVVRDRVGALDGAHRRPVEILSLAGPLPLAVLAGLVGEPVLLDLERLGVVTVQIDETAADTVHLAHPLYADVVRSEIPLLAQRFLAGQLVDALKSGSTHRAIELTRLASLYLLSGRRGEPSLLAAASRQSTAMADPVAGEQLARVAVAADPSSFAAQAALIAALHGQRLDGEAHRLLPSLTATAGTDDELVEVVRLLVAVGTSTQVDREVLEAEVASTSARVATQAARDAIAAEQAGLRLDAGDWESATRIALPLIERPDVAGEVRVAALRPAVNGLIALGRLHECVALADRLLPIAEGLDDPTGLAVDRVLVARVQALLHAGWLDEADLVATRLHERSLALPWDGRQAITGALLGVTQVLQGRLRTGQRLLRTSIAGLSEAEGHGMRSWALAHLGLAYALAGDPEGAEDALHDARAASPSRSGFLLGPVAIAETWIVAARVSAEMAIGQALWLAETAATRGDVLDELEARHLAARLGDRSELEPLIAVARRVDGPWPAGVVLQGRGLLAGDGLALSQASRAFESAGAMLVAAEAAAQAAVAHQDAGRADLAVAAARRSAELLGRCEGARSPAVHALPAAAHLTPREQEIGGLAAEGLSNRDIAERLHVSVRTVEGHLARAFAKVGVSSRGDLLDLFPTAQSRDDGSR